MSTSSQLNETVGFENISGYVDIAIFENLHQQFLNAVDLLELDISDIDSLEFEKHGTELCLKFDSHSLQNYSQSENDQDVLLVEEMLMKDELYDSVPENVVQDLECFSSSPPKQSQTTVKKVERGHKRELDSKNVHEDTEGFKIPKNSKVASVCSHPMSSHIQPKRRSKRIMDLKQLHENIASESVDKIPLITVGLAKIDHSNLLVQKMTRTDEAKDYIQPLKVSRCLLDKENNNPKIKKSGDVTDAESSDYITAKDVTLNSPYCLKLKLYKCFKCDSTFKRKSQYVTHLIKTHLNLLECSQCGHAFSHKKYLDKHVDEFHA